MAGTRRWTVSVRELAEFVWRKGDIGSQKGPLPGPTAHQGAAGHRWLQGSRDKGYLAEVHLAKKVLHNGLELEISGRADGIFLHTVPVVIEEIKTTTLPLMFIDGEESSWHWAQAKIYGALYLEENPQDSIDIQVTYFNIVSHQVRSFKKRFDGDALRAFLEETVNVYCDWIGRVASWHLKRDKALSNVAFPYPAFRKGQRELAEEVCLSLASDTRLFVQAPTGSGKTMAVVFGALKAFGCGNLSQIVYLTAKTVGRLSVERAVMHLRQAGTNLKSVSVVSREGICPYPDAGCRVEECPVAKGHYDRLPRARIALFERDTTGREDVSAVGRDLGVCPHALEMELVKWADIVICDYNYVFDPRVRMNPMTGGRAVARGLLVDEAHNLVERARQMYSFGIDSKRFFDLKRKLGHGYKSLKALCREIGQTLETIWDNQMSFPDSGSVISCIPDPFLRLLERAQNELAGVLESISNAEILEELRTLYFEITAFLRAAMSRSSSDVIYIEKVGKHVVLKSFCIDPSSRLSEIIDKSRAKPIFFSGTLVPLRYFARALSGSDADETRILPSPFPDENCRSFYVPGISTRYVDRMESADPVADTIRVVARAHTGNYLAFFPSHDYMNKVAKLTVTGCSDIDFLVQERGMTEGKKEKFLSHFRKDRTRSLVAFAVLGGLFAEGIDLVGARLAGAILVSPGLPKRCLERELLRGYFDREEGLGFAFAYLYPGMNKVLQGAGRVIRSEKDTGILVFVGDRFLERAYRDLLPPKWRNGEVVSERSTLGVLVREFWSSVSNGKEGA